jgi:penicillin-binding protein 1B
MEIERAISPEAAYLVTHLLEGVFDHGTAAGAREQGFRRHAAGKTGTTNDYRDAWFAGFTPDLLVVIWVGFDERTPLGLSGAQAALPIWVDFMKTATATHPDRAFHPPLSVRLVRIDPLTGGLATPHCPAVITEAFATGTEPRDPCPAHAAPAGDTDPLGVSARPRSHAAEAL